MAFFVYMMRLFLLSAGLLIATYGTAQPITRRWKQVDDLTGEVRSIIQLFQKDGKIAGRIVRIFTRPGEDPNPLCEQCNPDDPRYRKPVIGLEIVSDLEKAGSEYVNGLILDPENGRIYRCKVWLEGKNLKLRGYWGLFYRTQTWLPDE